MADDDLASGEIEELFTGNAGKVLSVSEDGRELHVLMRNGAIARVFPTEDHDLAAGEVILLGDKRWERAPAEIWTDETSVVVIRKVWDDQLLIETSLGLIYVGRTGISEVKAGNTVLYSPSEGILKVLSEVPVRIRDFDTDDDNAVEKFRVPRSEDGPTFDQFGGYPEVVARARELIETQLDKKEYLDAIGARPIKGIMFTGRPGTGKTLLAQIIANESNAEFFAVSGPAIVSKWLGDSEGLLRRIFEAAEAAERAIIFFDEIDSLAEQRGDDSHEASKRLVAQLLTLMDGFDNRSGGNVVVIAATNRVDDIDVALRRPGRFDWEIEFGMPNGEDRLAILEASKVGLKVDGEMQLEEIAERSEGWSAAKLSSIWTEAALLAASDSRFAITEEDLAEAFERVAARPHVAERGVSNGK